MRITSKGQVTIPQDIRERAGLMPGTDVAITYDGRTVEITKTKRSNKPTRGEQIVRRMRGAATTKLKMTTDEILALVRSGALERPHPTGDVLRDRREDWSEERRNTAPIKDQIMAISRRASRLRRLTGQSPEEVIGYDDDGLPH